MSELVVILFRSLFFDRGVGGLVEVVGLQPVLHDVDVLELLLATVKRTSRPVVLHLVIVKNHVGGP